MSPPTEVNFAPAKAAKRSAALRQERCAQRREMRELSYREVVKRLIAPSPALGSFRLDVLFVPTEAQLRPIPRFGPGRFEETLETLRSQGHTWADPKVRLRQLNPYQRRLLALAVMEVAPRAWTAKEKG